MDRRSAQSERGGAPASVRKREAAYETLVVGRCDGCRPRRGIARRGRTLLVGHGLRGHEIPRVADAGAAAAGELRVQLRRADALALHPDRDVPAKGHHVSLHFTVVNGTLTSAGPSFFGSNPAEVREGPKKGLRILGAEEDAARALLQALGAGQQAKAIIETKAPNDMLTMANVDIKPLSPMGITADALNANQRELLMKLIDVYIGYMASDIAADRTAKLKKAGVEKIGFVWAGETERGKKHYYRVQGPTFLIEYDNTQNDGNHIHSVWRDFDGDFGRDLLREHVKSTPHP